jgi:hypothetical protein
LLGTGIDVRIWLAVDRHLRAISAVERADISRVMRDVATGKTKKDEKTTFRGRRIVRGGEIVANRVQALLSKVFELAEEWKLRPEGSNPCRGVKYYVENKVERFLSTDELARLGSALTAAERGELLIEEVDPAAPRSRSSAGAKRRLGHVPKSRLSSRRHGYCCSPDVGLVKSSACDGRMSTSSASYCFWPTARRAPRRCIRPRLRSGVDGNQAESEQRLRSGRESCR